MNNNTVWSPSSLKSERKKEIFGFMMFDFANSSYTTVIITAIFNAYFVRIVVNQQNRGELLWSVALSVSYAAVILLGPILGAIADYSALKKKFLFGSYILCVSFTSLLFFIKPGDVIPAMIFVILSNIGFAASENFVSSFLTDIASEEDMGKISGYAWSFGYIGGLTSLVISLAILSMFPSGKENEFLGIRLTNLVTAFFFGIAAIPTFLWLHEKGQKRKLPPGETYFSLPFKRLKDTFIHIKEFKELMKFLLSFLFFNSGIAVVISFAAVYAQKDLGFTPSMTVLLIIVVNVTASVGAFLFGYLEDIIGSKNTIMITLFIWIITVTSAFFIKGKQAFWVVANLAGISMGASQSSARALVGLFSPESKSAEFFGFWGFAGKLSAIIGLLSFGTMSYLFSSNRIAILSTIFYFIVGIIILVFVDEKRGRKAANEYKE